jgi:hypothetical protein
MPFRKPTSRRLVCYKHTIPREQEDVTAKWRARNDLATQMDLWSQAVTTRLMREGKVRGVGLAQLFDLMMNDFAIT